MKSKKLIIFGYGGHARSVADIALACSYTQLLFVDDNAKSGENFLEHPVVKSTNEIDSSWLEAFPAAGAADKRHRQCQQIDRLGLSLVSLIAPTAAIGKESHIAPGCLIAHNAYIGPLAKIGKGSIVNTGAVVEHEVTIGEYSHVSVNATIAGRSKLGSYSMLGAGATVIDNICITEHVTIGAGAVVVKSILSAGTYIGVPALRIPLREE